MIEAHPLWRHVEEATTQLQTKEFLRELLFFDSDDPRMRHIGINIDNGRCAIALKTWDARRLGDIHLSASGKDATLLVDNLGWEGRLNANIRLTGEASLAVICNPQGCNVNLSSVFLRSKNCGFFWGYGSSAVSACVEVEGAGKCIVVGDDALISNDVWIRNYDMHGIHDLASGIQLNSPCDVVLERHVWLGQEALLLSCERIGFGAIVGARALVKNDVPSRSVVAGAPARVIRQNASWSRSEHDFSEDETRLLNKFACRT